MKKRSLDFLSNTQNKYSIRKFTVGTASIIIGCLIYIGDPEIVRAAEVETSLQQNSVNAVEKLNTDVATSEAVTTEKATSEAPTTEKATSEAPT
ncbi:YSIRK-type signal peptide-containing protein, partial [Macrococcus capreoli]